MRYFDRQDAGRQLAKVLGRFKEENCVVLALPRGGIVLAAEVAKELNAPLGLILVRKIGHPLFPEYAIGAIAEEEQPIYNEREVAGIDSIWLKETENAARNLIEKRRQLYYGNGIKPPEVSGKTAVIIDDGIATGLTMEASVRAIQGKDAKHIVVAVPVASVESVNTLGTLAGEAIVLDAPENFLGAVGGHYHKFDQVNDMEVRSLLREVNDYVHRQTTRNGQDGSAR